MSDHETSQLPRLARCEWYATRNGRQSDSADAPANTAVEGMFSPDEENVVIGEPGPDQWEVARINSYMLTLDDWCRLVAILRSTGQRLAMTVTMLDMVGGMDPEMSAEVDEAGTNLVEMLDKIERIHADMHDGQQIEVVAVPF